MKISEFDYFLPRSAIAQYPLETRDASRMMVIKKAEKSISHHLFSEIDNFIFPGDVLVVNDSRVIPARIHGWKESGGKVELLLLRKIGETRLTTVWDALVKPGSRVKEGTVIKLGAGAVAKVLERLEGKKWRLSFLVEGSFEDFLQTHGEVPLPPYIKRKDTPADRERYQTIFASHPGSVAAPTAGFHFSPRILEKIEARGGKIVRVTLHVGYGTFRPVETEEVERHHMEEEWYSISEEAAEEINKAKRVIAIGTTSARVLESVADERGVVRAQTGMTDLFIYPGYRFKRVDAMLTNFHLPRSTLILMAAAFTGKELLLTAYRLAVEQGYRFYSYGDCTLLLP
ncbi:MAG: tRNA preQ1(34) S-adenosylmethionine ribosyltransferase-isomerase QueA [Syntrophales bacterium]|nr:tRNA preQ1(34) S-adenosylmethionine ribosyltransferase-isomerase QueA [Syntrophales bacterium]